jgi:hypothetical protein
MPLLSLKMINDLRNRPPEKCFSCGQTAKKNYCRECDEWYWECGCNSHKGHRTYDLTKDPEPFTYVR